jgi:hypothetical protein
MADPTETYAHDDTPHPKTCHEMSRLANVSANDLMEDILRNLTLQALCYEIPRSKRFCPYGGPATAFRNVDRIPRDPGPIAPTALNSDRRATGYYAPRSVKDLMDSLISVCYQRTTDKGGTMERRKDKVRGVVSRGTPGYQLGHFEMVRPPGSRRTHGRLTATCHADGLATVQADATKCYARTPQYAPTPPHCWPRVRRALWKLLKVLNEAEPMIRDAKGSSRRIPKRHYRYGVFSGTGFLEGRPIGGPRTVALGYDLVSGSIAVPG